MPAEARPTTRKLPSGKTQLLYVTDGRRQAYGVYASKTEALRHFDKVVKPTLDGTVARRDVTLRMLADTFLDRHAKIASDRTIRTLRCRLKPSLERFGDITLAQLEGMVDEVAGYAAQQPERYRYSVMSALRQTLEAGVRYGHMTRNPAKLAGKNPQPKPRTIRVFTDSEIKKICGELDTRGAAAVTFAAATGLRPDEWARLERRDVDRKRRVLTVRGTKTRGSRREVPLTTAALTALDSLPPRVDSTYLFAGPKGGPFDVNNFRNREWIPAIETAGITKPARIYDLRSTFISNALANGLTVFEIARIAGTSVEMIEAHYGALLDTAADSLLQRLEATGQ